MGSNDCSLSEWPWTNHLPPLSYGLPGSEMGMMMVPTSQSDETSEIIMFLQHPAHCQTQVESC